MDYGSNSKKIQILLSNFLNIFDKKNEGNKTRDRIRFENVGRIQKKCIGKSTTSKK